HSPNGGISGRGSSLFRGKELPKHMWFRNVRRCAALAASAAGLLVVGVIGAGPVLAADDLAGKGAIGFSMGAMRFTSSGRLSRGGGVRPILRVSFKYTWQNRLVSVLEGGYGWNSYGEGGDYSGPDSIGTVAVITPFTAGLDYRLNLTNPKI